MVNHGRAGLREEAPSRHRAAERGAYLAGTIRTWLRQDKIKPWRYHTWQHATDPQCVDKAVPVLDLYQYAQELAAQGEAVVCT